MRDFTHIPRWSPVPWEHEELDPKMDRLILRAAHKLHILPPSDVVAALVVEGASEWEACLAVNAGEIISNDRLEAMEARMGANRVV